MLDYAKWLYEQAEGYNVKYHEFMFNYDKDDSTFHLFVENKSDPDFYCGHVSSILTSKQNIIVYKCNNKDGVIEVSSQISDEKRTLFILDRDHDDFPNPFENGTVKNNLPERIYITDNYSLESNFAHPYIYLRALSCLCHIHNHPQEINILNMYSIHIAENLRLVIELLVEFVIWYLHNRFDEKLEIYVNVKVNKALEYNSDGRIVVKPDALEILKIQSAKNKPMALQNISDKYRDMVMTEPLKYISPKPICNLMITWFTTIIEDLRNKIDAKGLGLSEDERPKLTYVMNINKSSFVRELTKFTVVPETLVSYVRQRL